MELTSKQRSNLRSQAQNIEPITQIGKGGISDTLVTMLDQALSKRELIKISVLDTQTETAMDLGQSLAKELNATLVCVIGRKIILYRYSTKPGVEHIEF